MFLFAPDNRPEKRLAIGFDGCTSSSLLLLSSVRALFGLASRSLANGLTPSTSNTDFWML